jgi:hypothetical protein
MAVHEITSPFDAGLASGLGGRSSKNGRFVALSSNAGTGVIVYEVLDDYTLVQRPVTAGAGSTTGFNGTVNDAIVTNDGVYLIEIAYSSSEDPRVLKWNGSAYVYLTTLTDNTSSYQTSVDYDEVNQRLAIGVWTAIYIYSHSGDTFTLVDTIPNDAGNLNSAQIEEIAWSNNGEYLAVAMRSGIQIYKMAPTHVKISFSVGAVGGGWGVSWSLDDAFVFLTVQAIGVGLFGWSRSGDVFTMLAGGGALAGDSFASSPVAFITGGEEYIFVMVTGGNVGRCYRRATSYSTFVTPASLGFGTLLGNQGYTTGGGVDYAASGRTFIFSQKNASPYAQGWVIDGEIPDPETIEGEVLIGGLQSDGELLIKLTLESDFLIGGLSSDGELRRLEPITADFNIGGLSSDGELRLLYPLTGDFNIGGLVSEGLLDYVILLDSDTQIGGLSSNGLLGIGDPEIVDNGPWVIGTGFVVGEPGILDWEISPIEAGQWIGGIPLIGGLVVEGDLRQRYELTGEFNIGGIVSGGFLDIDYQDIGGDVLIGGLQSSGELVSDLWISGQTLIGGLVNEAELDVILRINSQMLIGGLVVEGQLRQNYFINGDTLIGGILNQGLLDNLYLEGETLIGGLQSEGTLAYTETLSGDTLIGGLQMNAQLEVVLQIDCNMFIGGLQSDGQLGDVEGRRRRSFTVLKVL